LLAAAIAEAAGSAVWSRLETAPLSAVCRLLAVAAVVVPMVNWLAPGRDAVVACSVTAWLERSGSVRLNVMLSPAFGLEPSATEIDAGEPVGPVTVAPVKLELTLPSLKPNGEPAASSLIDTVEPEAAGMTRRPSPLAPWSACSRSAMTCVRPACEPLPLRMALELATDGVLTASPENM